MSTAFRVVQIFAFTAIEFHALDMREIGEAGGEQWVRGAGDAGTFAEVEAFVFLELLIGSI